MDHLVVGPGVGVGDFSGTFSLFLFVPSNKTSSFLSFLGASFSGSFLASTYKKKVRAVKFLKINPSLLHTFLLFWFLPPSDSLLSVFTFSLELGLGSLL